MTNAIDRIPTAHTTDLSQATAVEQARAIAEVQAAVVVAQQCPRDMARAEAEMRDSCGRIAFANKAFYRVTNRGNGPSVHMARELARIWGNIDYGVKELRRDDAKGTSEILAYAWDVQTNSRSTRTFVVPHQRMASGKRKDLTDLTDVYLNNQNIGARAVRECVFTVLPAWFTETAEDIARATLARGADASAQAPAVPVEDRAAEMLAAFATAFGVDEARIAAKLGKPRAQWDAQDMATMQVVYSSLRRGEITVDEEFGQTAPPITAGEFRTEDAAEGAGA